MRGEDNSSKKFCCERWGRSRKGVWGQVWSVLASLPSKTPSLLMFRSGGWKGDPSALYHLNSSVSFHQTASAQRRQSQEG